MHRKIEQDSKIAAMVKNETSLNEPLPGVLGNMGTRAFTFREQGILSNYFQEARELLTRLLGSREH